MTTIPQVTLRSGVRVPALAYGVGTALYKSDVRVHVSTALEAGFRFLDNAEVYGNEESAGAAIASFPGARELQVLTKVGAEGMKDLAAAGRRQRDLLRVDTLEGYLLHFPPRGQEGLPSNVDAWRALEKLKDDGVVKVIGVSNWLARDIQELVDAGVKYLPEINQIEYHPRIAHITEYQHLMSLQKKLGITTMTYSSLGPLTKPELLPQHGHLAKALDQVVGAKPGRTPTSVLIHWALQTTQGIVTTTTTKLDRAKEYLSIAAESDSLSDDEIALISQAGKQDGYKKIYMAKYMVPPYDQQ